MPGNLGQVESGELIMVVIIVMLLLFLGIFTYAELRTDDYEQRTQRLRATQVVQTAQQAASMRDISCGYAVETSTDCLDKYRLNIVNATDDGSRIQYYEETFGPATITVSEVYPSGRTWTVYNQTSEGDKTVVHIPVHIRNPITKNSRFGYLSVVKYT